MMTPPPTGNKKKKEKTQHHQQQQYQHQGRRGMEIAPFSSVSICRKKTAFQKYEILEIKSLVL